MIKQKERYKLYRSLFISMEFKNYHSLRFLFGLPVSDEAGLE